MRTQVVSVVLVVIAVQGCLAARDLRQVTMQCPEELSKPVVDYMQSAKYKAGVAKACAKRANPNCYMDCTCAAYSTLGAVLAYEGTRNHPDLLKQYGQACILVFTNKVIEDVLPEHVQKEHNRITCLQKVIDWVKDERAVEKCPALVEFRRDKGISVSREKGISTQG